MIEVDADEDGVLLRILDAHSLIQRNENVGRTIHDCFQLRLAQLAIEALGHIERNHFLRRSGATIRAAVFAAVAGVHYHGRKRFARVLDVADLSGRASAD